MKIGLFGGTFNPIHRCHLAVAEQAREHVGLDRILFIPTGDPPHKPAASLAPAHHRLEMVRLAMEGHPACAVSDIEVRRPGTSYSIDTVRELRAASGKDVEFFFLIGLDAFRELPTWRQADALLRECRFVVITRAGVSFRSLLDMPLFAHVIPDLRDRMEALDNGRERNIEVPVGDGGARVVLVSLPPCEATASEIRSRLQRRLSASNLLPAPVESYIMRHRLYLEGPDQTGK